MKVSFVIAGVMRCGTGALRWYLRQHPDIYMRANEIHFFNRDEFFNWRRLSDYDLRISGSYHPRFTDATPSQTIGDCTPLYTYWESAARRMHEYNPDMRIIMLVRNPIDRAFSQWCCNRSLIVDGVPRETLSFWDALMSERDAVRYHHEKHQRHFRYADIGFYSEQLRRLARHFPRNQILVLRQESLKVERVETLQQIFEFIGVDYGAYNYLERTDIHLTPNVGVEMTARERKYLRELYAPSIMELEQMLGWDLRTWRT